MTVLPDARFRGSAWPDQTVFWQVYPLGFTGAPVRPRVDTERVPTPRLRHLLGWLDHWQALGCGGLLLGPIFTSTSHGYDTTDHLCIDPRLGTETDFDALVTACRARGIRLVLDGVFNHVGAAHPRYQRALQNQTAAENRLFRIDWTSGTAVPADFEGHGDLIALNHSAPEVIDLVATIMTTWLKRGIDGWRLDAAYAVPPEFWAAILARVRESFPQAWFLGEMIHGDYADYVAVSGIDSVTQYELWKASWSSLVDANFYELDHALGRHNQLLTSFIPQTFIGNHDVTRIATRVGPERAVLAMAILATVGGIPSIYAGDEDGFTGTKYERFGGDDEIRPPFPPDPADLPLDGSGMRQHHRELLTLRRQRPWLVQAHTETLALTNTRYAYAALGDTDQRIDVILDLDPLVAEISQGGEPLWSYRPPPSAG
ncbi:MAG: alpha-amylase family protein [Propioniciclava sp.]